jgi:hypothetical protein
MVDSRCAFKGLVGVKRALPRKSAGFLSVGPPTPPEPAFNLGAHSKTPRRQADGAWFLLRYRQENPKGL